MHTTIRTKKGRQVAWNSLTSSTANNPWKVASGGGSTDSQANHQNTGGKSLGSGAIDIKTSPEILLQELKVWLGQQRKTLGPNYQLVEEVILTNPNQAEVESLCEGILGTSLHIKNFLRDLAPMRARYFKALADVPKTESSNGSSVNAAGASAASDGGASSHNRGNTNNNTTSSPGLSNYTKSKPANNRISTTAPEFTPGGGGGTGAGTGASSQSTPQTKVKKEKPTEDLSAVFAAIPDANPLLDRQESIDLLNPDGSSAQQAKVAAEKEATAAVNLFPTLHVQKVVDMPVLTVERRKKTTNVPGKSSAKASHGKHQAVSARTTAVCNCQGTLHQLFNNCTACGRIICVQESEGACAFCGSYVSHEFTSTNKDFQTQMKAEMDVALEIARTRKRRIEQQTPQTDSKYDEDDDAGDDDGSEPDEATAAAMAASLQDRPKFEVKRDVEDEKTRLGREAAEKHRDTLLQRAANKHKTGIIDEQADFYEFETAKWTSEADKAEQRAKAAALEEFLEAKRREMTLVVDPITGKVSTKRSEYADIESIAMLSSKQLRALMEEHELEAQKRDIIAQNNYIRSLDGQTDLPTHVVSASAPLKCSTISAYYSNSTLGGRARAIYDGLRDAVQVGALTGVKLENLFDKTEQPEDKKSGKGKKKSSQPSVKEPEQTSSKLPVKLGSSRVQHDADSYDAFATGSAFEASQALDSGDGGYSYVYGDSDGSRKARGSRPKSYEDNDLEGEEEEEEEVVEGEFEGMGEVNTPEASNVRGSEETKAANRLHVPRGPEAATRAPRTGKSQKMTKP